ncbi:MAG: hypothetical protein LBT59_06000 [Clostridiales bacterium]|jgi:F0F1-type ATP synthase membrane subunit b/b'|nr:hypothetical protein [Clostridiales bacterium]
MAGSAFERVRLAEAQAEELLSQARRDAAKIAADAATEAELLVEREISKAEEEAARQLAEAGQKAEEFSKTAWIAAQEETKAMKDQALGKIGEAAARIVAAFA